MAESSDASGKAPGKRVVMTPKLQALGRTLVMQLYMVLRTVRIHDPSNKALLLGTEKLKDTINTLWAVLGGSVRLQFVEQVVYVNDVRLRTDASTAEQIESLAEEFVSRGLGGLAFSRPVDTSSLRDLLVLFSKPADTEEARSELYRSLADLRDLALELLGPKSFQDEDDAEQLRIDRKTFALQTYAKAIIAVREFVAAIREGKDTTEDRLHVTRIVMDLIDVATERVNFMLRMAVIKQAHEYAFNHAANTCIISVVIGKAMGIDRLALVDLGTAALFADAAYAALPSEILDRPEQLSEEDRIKIHDLRLKLLRTIIGKRRLTEGVMRRVIVAYEHSIPFRDPETRRNTNTHLFSRIVAIASAFDALTTRRPWREAYSPDEALKIMLEEAGTRFDPLIVLLLVNLLGIYPLGTAVKLDTGELALVYHNSNKPELFERPIVKVLRDAQGQRVKGVIIRNLATHVGPGGTIMEVASVGEVADLDAGQAIVF